MVQDGRARLQTITLGERNEDFAQVLTGLAAGDAVILHPSDTVADGVAVTPLP
jgi:HlyD family secretion protein